MTRFSLTGCLLVRPLKTGASSPTGIVLIVASVVFVNLVIYVGRKVWQMMSESDSWS